MQVTQCPTRECLGYKTEGLTSQLATLAASLPPPCSGMPASVRPWRFTSRDEWSEIFSQGYAYKKLG